MTKQAKLSFLVFGAFTLVTGCSSSSTPLTVELPQSLKIGSIDVVGSGQSWTPQNQVALPRCPGNVPVLVSISPAPVFNTSTSVYTIDNFTLAVPGDCGINLSCGWLKLRVTSNDAAPIELSSASSPITVNGLSTAGQLTFSLELHDAYDIPFKGSDGMIFGDEVTVDFVDSDTCAAPPTAGDAGI